MQPEKFEVFAKHYGFDEWRGTTTTDERVFFWQFRFNGSEFAGWRPHRIQPIAEGTRQTTQSTWQRPEGGDRALLNVVVDELPSLDDAHLRLIEALGEFQSPQIAREQRPVAGDVSFAIPGGYSALFARANLVVHISNGGEALVPVAGIARDFDAWLVRRPELPGAAVVPEIHRFTARSTDIVAGRAAALDLDASDPLGRPLWFKFYSGAGEVLAHEGGPAYLPRAEGAQRVEVYAINPNGGVARAELTLTVGGTG